MKRFIPPLTILLVLSFLFIPSISYGDQVHRVSRGETLFLVAQKHGISMDSLLRKNPFLRDHNTLFENQVLIIPSLNTTNNYRIQSGDTLFKISQKLGVPMAILAEANQLTNWNDLRIDQVLTIPATQIIRYSVKSGDTLFKISQELGVPMAAIAETNQLTNWNSLHIGQVLNIPLTQNRGNATSQEYRPSPLIQKYPNSFYEKGSTNKKQIALTFDDGPDRVYTTQILNLLRTHNVPATFFFLGQNAEKHPDLVRRAVAEGHTIANHTLTHPDLRTLTPQTLRTEIGKTESILESITGLKTAMVRPPYGFVTESTLQQLESLNYRTIKWSVDSLDWRDQHVDQILINTLPQVREDSILLFHDAGGNRSATVGALWELIETLKAHGYTFVTVDQLLGVPAYQ